MIPPQSQSNVWITIEPAGRRILIPAGTTILSAAQAAGIQVTAVCGGKGTCVACKVLLVEGEFSPISSHEAALLQPGELSSGLRLACQTSVISDAKVQFPPASLASLQRLQLEGASNTIALHPAVQRIEISISSPALVEKQSDAEKVREALKVAGFPHTDLPDPLLPQIEKILRGNEWKVSAILQGHQLVAFLPSDQHMLGLAVDLGTTKIAAFLVDLQNGQTLASAGVVNPQIAYGEDVISRIQYSDEHADGAVVMQRSVVNSLNELVRELTSNTNTLPSQIVDCAIVGNTAMHHLLAGLPVHSLGTAPYLPARVDSMNFPANEIGLLLAYGARVYLPPNIAGFVGGDHIAMLLATQARHTLKTVVAMDIGTNTEISLIHKGRHLSCSCASGPAFEGAHIRDGLRAIPGAIERVFIGEEGVKIQTIQNQPAIGICGSGLLDVVAEMRKVGLLDARGAFQKGQSKFVLVSAKESGCDHEIAVSRKDVNEIQLAKAAIRSGVEVLLRQADIQAEDIDLFLVAGAFGTYLDVANCVRIGMFPKIPLDRFHQVGNAAGSGARELLASTLKRSEAGHMIEQIEYVELTTIKDYVDFFADAICLN